MSKHGLGLVLSHARLDVSHDVLVGRGTNFGHISQNLEFHFGLDDSQFGHFMMEDGIVGFKL